MRQCAIILLLLPAALTVFANDKSNHPWVKGKPPESIVSSDAWLSAYKILDDKEQAVGLVLSTDKQNLESVKASLGKDYIAETVQLNTLGSLKDKPLYQLNNSNGEVEGWFSPLNSAGNDLESKVPGVELLKVSASAQVLEELEPLQIKQTLIENARAMACDSIIMPKNITVGMSAGVAVELVAGANGAMSIQMSWDTTDLCRDLM